VKRSHRGYDPIKRLLDVVAGLALLVLLSPVLLGTAIAVLLKLGRPVLFSQHRPGKGGRLFTIYKFRTMAATPAETTDAALAVASDADRLTSFGRFLRSSSLDELPELYNVVRGDMSFVGPRPLLPEYLPRYNREQARRHEVRPGITGWAQVNGRNATSWEERFAMDVYYVDNRSLALDARILAMTVGTVVKREGVSAPGSATMEPFDPAPQNTDAEEIS
jgi:lipopolysaccharide/colanic/teichoic acid biosynthesis glycosyltransferase